MAGSSAAAASSSFISTRKKYDVFISFRGEDTRSNFTSHLYRAFSDKKIKAYIDEESLKKGAEISPTLMKAIEESKISVVILSKDYASSSWCLEELNHILQCKETNNQIVVPVFYGVDPSDARKQEGNTYDSAFGRHQSRFEDEKVEKWKNSLMKVANLKGFDSSKFGSDSQLLEAILEDVLEKLRCMLQCCDFKYLVGIERRIQHVEPLLNINSLDVHIVGIWGMGGIGKTTLAHAIFSRFAHQFEGSYFLENVKEESKKHGLTKLQKKFFSILLEEKLKMVDQFVMKKLRHTKVLIVLDDVDDIEQLEYLVGDCDWFGRGSKIIVTTRDMEVLKNIDLINTYVVEELNFDESWHLFCSKAFQQSSPSTDYDDLLAWVVHYCKGIPLALTVLGRHLRSKSAKEWKSELDKLKKIPNEKVHKVLKISYDGLDCNEKEIFLDIACFFKGEDKDFVKKILDAYGTRYMDSGIQVLINKALITITSNKLHMHDLLQELGWKIIYQESKEPGERSRLWSAEDILKVLKHNTGTKAVEGISLESGDLREVIRLNPRVFKKMYNLKYLKFSIVQGQKFIYLPKGLECLPDELRYLFWMSYPLKSLPSSFKPTNLVELHLSRSKLEYLWKGVPNLENLKVLDLHESQNLVQIPNLSRAVNLEKIVLNFCEHLKNLPSSISKLQSLQYLDLSYCKNFNEFPDLPVNLKHLDMEVTPIEEVIPSIGHLSHLEILKLSYCTKLKCLPITISKLKSLRRLHLYGCIKLESFPEILEPLENLTDLDLRSTGITKLPSSIENLVKVQMLLLNGCKNLQFIPDTINNILVTSLDFSNFPKPENLSPLSMGLRCLMRLELDDSSVSEIPFGLFYLPFLETLSLRRTEITRIPESIKYSKLLVLNLLDCKSLHSLPELPFSLKGVYASGCTSLQMVSNSSIEIVSKASTLLTKVPDYMKDYYREQFEFVNCLRLDQKNIIIEFQSRALCLGIGVRAIPKQMKVNQTHYSHPGVSICFPGVEIPKWFNYQNKNGCSINMKLAALHCYDTTNFMGFALCVVVSDELNGKSAIKYDCSVVYYCDIIVETNNGRMCLNFEMNNFSGYAYFSSTSHVLMWYFHKVDIDLFSAKEISFNFRVVTKDESGKEEEEKGEGGEEEEEEEEEYYPTFKVERCGIRMLLLKDAEEFGIMNSSEFVHPKSNVTNELEQSELKIFDLETNEPHPKRTKFSS